MFMSYSTLHEGGAMPQGDCETSGTRNGASCGESGLGAGRKPCCRRRGGGGGALVEPAALAALLHAGGYGYDMRKIILEKTDGHVDVDVGNIKILEEKGFIRVNKGKILITEEEYQRMKRYIDQHIYGEI